jgi:hypothetical protein
MGEVADTVLRPRSSIVSLWNSPRHKCSSRHHVLLTTLCRKLNMTHLNHWVLKCVLGQRCYLITVSLIRPAPAFLLFTYCASLLSPAFRPILTFASLKDINYHVLTQTPIRKRDPREESFDFATSDTVLMHAAIILSAYHWVRLGGNPDTVVLALYHHKVEAIRIINERLGDPAKATLDGTVGAIAVMTIAEVKCSPINPAEPFIFNFPIDHLW